MGTLRYDVTLFLVLALLTEIKAHVAHTLLPLSGLLAGVKPRVKLLAYVIPYSGNPKVDTTLFFSFALLKLIKAHFVAHMLLPLSGLLAGVKPRVKLLTLAIPYSGKTKVGLRYDTVLALALLT